MKRIVILLTLIPSLSVSFGQCDLDFIDRSVEATIAEKIFGSSRSSWVSMCPDSTEVEAVNNMQYLSNIQTRASDGQEYEFMFRFGVLLRIIDKTAQMEYSFCDDQIFHCKLLGSKEECDRLPRKKKTNQLIEISDQLVSEFKDLN